MMRSALNESSLSLTSSGVLHILFITHQHLDSGFRFTC